MKKPNKNDRQAEFGPWIWEDLLYTFGWFVMYYETEINLLIV